MRRSAATVGLVVGLTLLVLTAREVADAGQPSEDADRPITEVDLDDPELIQAGEELYLTGCVSCHGVGGIGADEGPPLIDVGAAGADFMLSTGRMPQAGTERQSLAKPSPYDRGEINALVAYVASLGDGGPGIPELRLEDADLAEGGELYRANCAACHNAAGSGGALTVGQFAPSLHGGEPLVVAEAVRYGPGQMPVFGQSVFDDDELDAVVRYVDYLRAPDDEGGFGLGHTGPITEGFAAWLVGITSLLVIVRFITREPRHEPR